MTKKTAEQLALEALEAYMAGLNEKKLNKTDEQILGIQFRESNGWKEKNQRRRKEDPTYDKRVGAKISQTYSTPEMKAVQASKAQPHREETKERIRQIQLVRPPRTKETRKKMGKSKLGNDHHASRIMTPSGSFASYKEAGAWARSQGLTNAIRKIQNYVNERPSEFYILSEEEYQSTKDQPHIQDLDWLLDVKKSTCPIATPLGWFETQSDAIKLYTELGLIKGYAKFKRWMKERYVEGEIEDAQAHEEFFLGVKKGHRAVAIMTPKGRFESVGEAAKAFGFSTGYFHSILKKNPREFYRIK